MIQMHTEANCGAASRTCMPDSSAFSVKQAGHLHTEHEDMLNMKEHWIGWKHTITTDVQQLSNQNR